MEMHKYERRGCLNKITFTFIYGAYLYWIDFSTFFIIKYENCAEKTTPFYIEIFLFAGGSKVVLDTDCSDTDRAQFNSNLLLTFSEQYDELQPSQQTPLSSNGR